MPEYEAPDYHVPRHLLQIPGFIPMSAFFNQYNQWDWGNGYNCTFDELEGLLVINVAGEHMALVKF
jgi:hypothetical protein